MGNASKCFKQECGTLLPDLKGRSTRKNQTFSADDDRGIELYQRQGLESLGGTVRHIVAEKWIAILEPKKQANFPYKNLKNPGKKPSWWPPNSQHDGPQHVKGPGMLVIYNCLEVALDANVTPPVQINWYIGMFQGKKEGRFPVDSYEGSWKWFWEGVCKSRDRLEEKIPPTKSLDKVFEVYYDMLKLVKLQHRFDRGEIDGSSTIDVRPVPARSPRIRRETTFESEEKDDASEDDRGSDGCNTPTTVKKEEEPMNEPEPEQTIVTMEDVLDHGSSSQLSRIDQSENIAPTYLSFFPQPERLTHHVNAAPSSSQLDSETPMPNVNSSAQFVSASTQVPALCAADTMNLTPQQEWNETFTDMDNLQIQLFQTQLLQSWDDNMAGVTPNEASYTPNLSHQTLDFQAQYHGSLPQDPLLLQRNRDQFEQSQAMSSIFQTGNHPPDLQHGLELDANQSPFR
ncbi:MAG: hypothetical protein Q9160_008359 [Pyrenula sp. 1 TL-2023]